MVGGCASSRCQISVAPAGGANGSITATSPPDSTDVDVTMRSPSPGGAHLGCGMRQIQRPGATSISRRYSCYSCPKGLLQVLDQIPGILQTDREAHEPFAVRPRIRSVVEVWRHDEAADPSPAVADP